jgi:HSP20 family protein
MIPWAERIPQPLFRFDRDMANMMERFFGPEGDGWLTWPRFTPTTNVAETDNEYEVTVELPGMKPDEFNVEMHNGDLLIKGEKKEEKEEQGKTYHRIERSHGEFRRLIPLPGAVDEEKITADYKEGVLKITVPKTAESKVRHIEVKS